MTARLPAVDAELMLHAQNVRVAEIQKVRRTTVGVEILLQQLEAHTLRIIVTLNTVIDGADKTIGGRRCRRDGFTQIMGEGRDAAEPWEIIAEKGDALRRNGSAQDKPLIGCVILQQTAWAADKQPGFV